MRCLYFYCVIEFLKIDKVSWYQRMCETDVTLHLLIQDISIIQILLSSRLVFRYFNLTKSSMTNMAKSHEVYLDCHNEKKKRFTYWEMLLEFLLIKFINFFLQSAKVLLNFFEDRVKVWGRLAQTRVSSNKQCDEKN